MFSTIRRKETDMARAPAGTALRAKLRLTPIAWRLTLWGAAACAALTATSLAAISESGAARLQLAANNFAGQPAVVAQIPRPAGPSPETIKLAEDVRQLTAERERLNTRLASLEHLLEDVTGSVKRQAAAQEAARLPKAAEPASANSIATSTSSASKPAAPSVAAAVASGTPTPTISASATTSAADAPAAEPAATLPAVPLPPERFAAVETPTADLMQKPEIGVDLGGALSPDALRAHWAALKATIGPSLGPLTPMMVTRDAKPGSPPYRLIIGPLPSSTAAAAVCARLAPSRTFCQPANFLSHSATLL
jgi:hypothetical protein